MKLTKWEDQQVFRAICHVLLLISDEKNTDMCCLLLAASCCRTNHQLGTGVSAASCHSRGGLFYQVIVPKFMPHFVRRKDLLICFSYLYLPLH